jgi:hypothetical protein
MSMRAQHTYYLPNPHPEKEQEEIEKVSKIPFRK